MDPFDLMFPQPKRRAPGQQRPRRERNPLAIPGLLLALLPVTAWLASHSWPAQAVACRWLAMGAIPAALLVNLMGLFRRPRWLAGIGLALAVLQLYAFSLAFPFLLP